MTTSSSAAAIALPPEPISHGKGRLDPFDWYAEMRQGESVSYDDRRQTWDVFRYEDVDRILRDHERFTSDLRQAHLDVPDEDSSGESGDSLPARTMLQTDPPDHERLRGFAEDRFRQRTIARERPRFERLAADLLDGLEGKRRFDLVEDFADPLTVSIIAEMLAVPVDHRDQFKRWSEALIAHADEDSETAFEETQRRRGQAYRELSEYFSTLLDERTDGDDLVALAAANEDLDRSEKLGFCILILLAGSVSTTSLITNALWCFAEHDVIEAVRAGTIDRSQAIEEVLRYRSPEQAVRRVAVEDIELRGRDIGEGDLVTVWLGSANRDPTVFDDPDEFRPARRPNPHLAFGNGPHYCFGVSLARIEADVAIQQLLERFETIEPDLSSPEPYPTFPYHSLRALPCKVEPRGSVTHD